MPSLKSLGASCALPRLLLTAQRGRLPAIRTQLQRQRHSQLRASLRQDWCAATLLCPLQAEHREWRSRVRAGAVEAYGFVAAVGFCSWESDPVWMTSRWRIGFW